MISSRDERVLIIERGMDMFLDDRKKRILQAIVEDYVRYAEPIASKDIVERYDLGLSSATVRNVMAELEEMGLIEKTHTSSGRIPSDLGYRYYVDSLMSSQDLTDEELTEFSNFFEKEREDMLENVSKALSELTHYTTISIDEDDVHLSGRNNVFDYPEFRDFEKLKSFMYLLEKEDLIREIISSSIEKEINIKIGCENPFDEVKEYGMITFPYKERGSIAIIGPKRMDYSKVISYIQYLLNDEWL